MRQERKKGFPFLSDCRLRGVHQIVEHPIEVASKGNPPHCVGDVLIKTRKKAKPVLARKVTSTAST
jgi:hypothetical protein